MKTIFDFEIGNNLFEIGLSTHAQERMVERGVAEDDIIDNILSLTTKQMEYLNRNSLESIIINKETKTAVVIGFNTVGLVTVMTVITGDNTRIKANTIEILV